MVVKETYAHACMLCTLNALRVKLIHETDGIDLSADRAHTTHTIFSVHSAFPFAFPSFLHSCLFISLCEFGKCSTPRNT